MKKVLTIAGSDCSGGAGIQADIKTITAHRMYAMSAVTALTAQNTTGVYGVMEAAPEFVAEQLDCIFNDIRPDAVKIGMVASAGIISAIAGKLREYSADNIVLDPVMVSTSGGRLLRDDAAHALITELMPLAAVITPNIPEAEALSGISIKSREDMIYAGRALAERLKTGILIKGGHLAERADDLLITGRREVWFNAARVDNPNTHGTGCTLSSAVACGLAAGFPLTESIGRAKKYITGALLSGLDLGRGPGPLDHMYAMENDKTKP